MTDRLLIVEDDEDARENLALLLELKGHEVETARHGLEALEKLREIGPPCLIILDLMMPVMDGWEFRGALCEDSTMRDVPVVLLSGIADVNAAARQLHVVDHLSKPVDLGKR